MLVARALRGGRRSARTVSFSIDRIAPVVAITGVADGAASSAASAQLGVAASDAHLLASTLTLDFAPFAGGAVTTEGRHVVVATAIDLAGNTTTRTIVFWLDRIAPTTVATVPGGLLDAHSTIALDATDTWEARHLQLGSGVATTYYALDGVAVAYVAPIAPGALQGTHTLTFWSVDAAGNEESQRTATLHFGTPGTATRTTVTAAATVVGQTALIAVDVTTGGAGTPTGTVRAQHRRLGRRDADRRPRLVLGQHADRRPAHDFAAYGGDSAFGSSDGSTSQTVARGATSTALSAPTAVGTPFVVTATLTAVAPAAGTPGGTVTFLEGATTLAIATLTPPASPVPSSCSRRARTRCWPSTPAAAISREAVRRRRRPS